MPSFIPAEPTIAQIAAGDKINYDGQTCTVDSVASIVDHGDGRISAAVTFDLPDDTDVTLTVSTADTICSSYGIDASGNQSAVWSQTKQA